MIHLQIKYISFLLHTDLICTDIIVSLDQSCSKSTSLQQCILTQLTLSIQPRSVQGLDCRFNIPHNTVKNLATDY